jgi:hypothetical protein
VNILELSNAEMGTFRVRLLRKGEEHGLHHQLIYNDDEPAIEFYGPAAEGERPADAHFMGRFYAWQFRHPSDGWSSVGLGGYCGVSPENSRAIAAWLERELNRPWTPPPPRPRPPSQARANRPIELQHAGNRRVTLYVGGLFGYVNKEAEWVRVDRRPYAQYVDAIFVEYLPRRARRARQMILTDDPDLVILLGWEHPDLQQATETEEQSSPYGQRDRKMTITKMKYAGADPRYEQEFESALDAYLASLPLTQLLLDMRGETITEQRGLTRRAIRRRYRSSIPVASGSVTSKRHGRNRLAPRSSSATTMVETPMPESGSSARTGPSSAALLSTPARSARIGRCAARSADASSGVTSLWSWSAATPTPDAGSTGRFTPLRRVDPWQRRRAHTGGGDPATGDGRARHTPAWTPGQANQSQGFSNARMSCRAS